LTSEVFYLAPTEALNNVHSSEVLPETSKLPAEDMPTEDTLSHILIIYDWQPWKNVYKGSEKLLQSNIIKINSLTKKITFSKMCPLKDYIYTISSNIFPLSEFYLVHCGCQSLRWYIQ
jgi:hypothetical protein